MKYCSFFGHRDYHGDDELEQKIKNIIIDVIENKQIYNFLLGGYGGFDNYCARYINDMKKIYPQIKSYLVLAYINKKLDEFDKNYLKEIFDGTIYPPLESVPPRYAILKRNEWIINNSEYIIFFVNHSWGGACTSFDYAKRKNKDYINIGTKKEP